ncbi:helix-turn-helix domain-containing protein [uncultured Enorma sp.]|uniref:helix-turn-helix domain-containing protein n=1 Tax=uncultured Enorma sp. TaxID=1714346 RepID=UPI002803B428|nr:helix-turn-helix domain-containing protein [uncultured Enorma sp.]
MKSPATHHAKNSSSTCSPALVDFPSPLSKYGDLLTVDNMAEVLDVSTRTVYRLTDGGELPSVKVGRRLYFPKHLLIEALCL